MAATSSIVAAPRAASVLQYPFLASVAEDKPLGLPREFRLRNTRDIQRVQRHGKRIRLSSVMVLFSPACAGQIRVALTVSRKVGNAVVRNQVKRWLREALRQQLGTIPTGFDVVVIAHPQSATAGLSSLSKELEMAWPKFSGATS